MMQYVASGLVSGGIYATMAIGIVLIYRASGVINFAHGELATFGTFVVFACWSAGLPLPLALLIGLLVGAVASPCIEAFVLSGLRRRTHLTEVMATVALFLALNGLTLAVFGEETHEFPALVTGPPIEAFGLVMSRQSILVLVVVAGLTLIMAAMFRFTRLGAAMRAVSESRESAELAGLPVRRIVWSVWAVAGMAGVLAGVLIAPIVYLNVNMMIDVLTKALAGAVVGGLTSVSGAITAGLLLGVGESLVAGYVSTQLATPFVFLVLVLALVVRPQGLFGSAPKVKL
ncbi:branched-chain amino acid ABC transporter permease [Microtetraspora sp. NBRC 16547]|uniref:branched-chain amino acid ABC transporter permease n=1 Tax=Microtetraspora sp. NBRC 16547 TaxID=3030993 RepID=UPI0024A2F17C|nr:branched-chain amino acid ABC transporter permease [Microtetraspora sp. NBRC 16547]GLW99336.1 branched-chain amino acid ABC transporter permease [Microtetraspora sp. NBRC 16547]